MTLQPSLPMRSAVLAITYIWTPLARGLLLRWGWPGTSGLAQWWLCRLCQQGFSKEVFQEVHCLRSLLKTPHYHQVILSDCHPGLISSLHGTWEQRHLFDSLKNYSCRTKEEAWAVFWQLISAVQYCPQRIIVHQDLKPENILLDSELNIKLADIGFLQYRIFRP